MKNKVVFVGGPWDGEVRAVQNLDPIKVWTVDPRMAQRADPNDRVGREAGRYVHGTGGQRGKMLWQPTTPEEDD